jgi:hypothetical protein
VNKKLDSQYRKEGKKEGRKEGKKEGRKEGKKEGRKEGKKEGRKEGGRERGKSEEGGREGRKTHDHKLSELSEATAYFSSARPCPLLQYMKAPPRVLPFECLAFLIPLCALLPFRGRILT